MLKKFQRKHKDITKLNVHVLIFGLNGYIPRELQVNFDTMRNTHAHTLDASPANSTRYLGRKFQILYKFFQNKKGRNFLNSYCESSMILVLEPRKFTKNMKL